MAWSCTHVQLPHPMHQHAQGFLLHLRKVDDRYFKTHLWLSEPYKSPCRPPLVAKSDIFRSNRSNQRATTGYLKPDWSWLISIIFSKPPPCLLVNLKLSPIKDAVLLLLHWSSNRDFMGRDCQLLWFSWVHRIDKTCQIECCQKHKYESIHPLRKYGFIILFL